MKLNALSKNSPIILFETKLPIKCGITTKKFGNFSTAQIENGSKSNLFSLYRKLIKTLGAKELSAVIPQGGITSNFVFPGLSCLNLFCGDALFYDQRNLISPISPQPVLGSTTGDCPIIILYTGRGLILVHSGWKGTLENITKYTIDNHEKNHGRIKIEKTFAIIWPGICSSCYDVGEEFFGYFPEHTFMYNGQPHVRLSSVIKDQLISLGLLENNISIINACSRCSSHLGERIFFSDRKKEKSRNLVFAKML